MQQLKSILNTAGTTQAELARHCGMSGSTVAQLINHGVWPRRTSQEDLRQQITGFLKTKKVRPAEIEQLFKRPEQPDNHPEENDMLLRKQTLTPDAMRAFGISHRGLFGDIEDANEMWISQDMRYVREHMYQTAKHGGFLAVVGESGAGKTTVAKDLEDRIERDGGSILMIRPYVIAAEDNDKKGKTLKSTHIAEAILRVVAPMAPMKSSPEARFAQLHKALKDSYASGYRHCLLIEEAHSLPIPTLKHLKRILELQQGFTKLLSVILVGQPELLTKLSERNAEVREVVQRCEVVKLQPIEPGKVEEFLNHRLGRTGKKARDIINQDGITALCQMLVNRDRQSQLYPLAVGNVMIAAMNIAARLGAPVVDDEIVKDVISGH